MTLSLLPLPLLLALACNGKDAGTDDTGEVTPIDADEDGFDADEDCNDADPAVFPGADELCNGVDDDCDDAIDEDAIDQLTWYGDGDADGYGTGEGTTGCDQPPDTSDNAGDCDDADRTVYPGASELCDGILNDCDGTIGADEVDADGDGFVVCDVDEGGWDGDGTVTGGGDCVDDNLDVYPGAPEICQDGVVNDCDGTEDDALAFCALVWPETLADADAELVGEDQYDYAGARVATGGDVDGDGRGDIVVGAPYNETASENGGAAYLVLGGVLGQQSLATAAEARITSSEGGAYLGSAVALGDISGDSGTDVIVNAPRQSHEGGGEIYIYQGPVTGDLGTADASVVIGGTGDSNLFGAALSAQGDFDDDGADDLFVGAPSAYTVGQTGAAALFPGPVDADATAFGASLALSNLESNSQLGRAVSLAGDVNGDGMDDLLMSAPNAGESGEGAAYLVLGSTTLTGGVDISTDAEAVITGEQPYSGFGEAVAVADIDGDGSADVVVGAGYADDGSFSYSGAVYVFSGSPSGALVPSGAALTLTGEDDYDGAGAAVANGGDVDGDGMDELLVGAPYRGEGGTIHGGRTYLVLGGSAGTVSLADADQRIEGLSEYDGAGTAVAGGSDLDGDGLLDTVIGAYYATDGARNGSAYVLYNLLGY